MKNSSTDIISPEQAQTLGGLFRERVKRSPDCCAYHYFDHATTSWQQSSWSEMAVEVARWQVALESEALQVGDRVALMAPNSRAWVCFEQAALGLGLP